MQYIWFLTMSTRLKIVLIYVSFSSILTFLLVEVFEKIFLTNNSNHEFIQVLTIAFSIIFLSTIFLYFLLRHSYIITKRNSETIDTKNKIIKYFNEVESRFNAIAEKGDDMFVMINQQQEMFYSSPNIKRILGYEMEEYNLNSGLNYVHPDDIPSVTALMIDVNSNPGISFPFQYRVEHKQNKYCWVEGTSINLLHIPKVNAIISNFRDITEKKNIRDRIKQRDESLYLSNEKFKLISKATKDTIWDCDLASNEINWNIGLAVNFGYASDTVSYNANWWRSCIHPDDRERVIKKIENYILQARENWEDEYRFKDAKGRYRNILDRGFICYDNEKVPRRMVGVMQDLTLLKQTEMELVAVNKELEAQAADLVVSNEELERFAYVASHDLQEPLRMVSSFLFLLEKKYKDQLDETALQYIGFAVDAAERMKVLIHDLLEYSKASNTEKLSFEPFNLNEVLNGVKQTFSANIHANEYEINYPNLPIIVANKTQITQLFQNLIGNSIKYTKKGVVPKISIDFTENDAQWQFEINDNGIGIQQQYLEQIFVIFHRLHGKSQYSGTGIGLATCKKIVEKHKGKIWAESVYGMGSTFKFQVSKKISAN